MARIPDDDAPAWQQFENLVVRILELSHFDVEVHTPRGDKGYDLNAQFDQTRWAIEVKYYRTAKAQPTLIDAAAARVAGNGISDGIEFGMLVVSCIVPDELRSSIESRYGITLLGREDLQALAAVSPEILEELDNLVEATGASVERTSSNRSNPLSPASHLTLKHARAPTFQGRDLCNTLRGLKRGKKTWAIYEDLCSDILKYLFPGDLQGWHRQKRTDDGLNRYDLICRIKPTTEFWQFLITHLNSRYVLFEFKNYDGKIKQGQVLTTEKYLLDRGLRRSAIVISRAGADKNAITMTQGAMREHGKLMLVLDDDAMCDMLHRKDRGEDPTDKLFELADDFLLRLPR